MVQAIVNLGEREDRVLTIIRGKYGLKNKSDAMNFVIGRFEDDLLEPELRPEYAEKLKAIKAKKGIRFKDISELKRHVENARV
jgi:hypothetical protein